MEEVKKRWIRCLVWQQVVGTVLWISWDMAISLAFSCFGWMPLSEGALPSLWGFFRFLVFQICLAMLLVAHCIVTSPEEKAAASVWEMTGGLMGAVLGGGGGRRRGVLRRRAQTSGDWFLFVLISTLGGFLALFSVTGGLMQMDVLAPFHMALRGAALGFIYGLHYVYKKRWVLSFPIIQRPLFFQSEDGHPLSSKKSSEAICFSTPFLCLNVFPAWQSIW